MLSDEQARALHDQIRAAWHDQSREAEAIYAQLIDQAIDSMTEAQWAEVCREFARPAKPINRLPCSLVLRYQRHLRRQCCPDQRPGWTRWR